jgi:hypothetical protein
VALGLSPSDAIWIVFVAAMCNAIPTVMNGAIGADLHIVESSNTTVQVHLLICTSRFQLLSEPATATG